MAMSELSARSAAITMSSERLSSSPPSPPKPPPSPRAPSPPAGSMLPSVIVGSPLPSGELRLPRSILHEAAHAGALVLRREQAGEVQPLDFEPSIEISVKAGVDRLLGGPQRDR